MGGGGSVEGQPKGAGRCEGLPGERAGGVHTGSMRPFEPIQPRLRGVF